MAIVLKHQFNCAKADGNDATAVKPSDWNAQHTLTAAAGKVLGTTSDSTTVTELPLSVDPTGQAILLPSGTTAQRPGSPLAGMTRYNTTTGLQESFVGGAWSSFDSFPPGTKMLFQQTNAPTGWTKDVTHNNKALRVVSGAAGSGGSWNFTDVFTNRSISGTAAGNYADIAINYHTLSWNEMPAHTHDFPHYGGSGGGGTSSGGTVNYRTTTSAGASWGHTHGVTQNPHGHTLSASVDMAVAYVDLIIATKN
jgi:hypothetical protein